MTLMRKGIFALLATYVAVEVLLRTSFVFGVLVGGVIGAVVGAWLW